MKKYFVCANQCEGLCYHEFYKGKWDRESFWSEDSIYIYHGNFINTGFEKLLLEVLPTYNPFGETEITESDWEKIVNKALVADVKNADIVNEVGEWIQETFKKYDVFTVLGV